MLLLAIAVAVLVILMKRERDMGAFRPPPPEWDSGPFPLGEPNYKYFEDVRELDAYCRAWGVGLPEVTGSRYINACYINALNSIALPHPATWPGGHREVNKMRRHEEGHARGGHHGRRESEWVPAPWFNALTGAGSN